MLCILKNWLIIHLYIAHQVISMIKAFYAKITIFHLDFLLHQHWPIMSAIFLNMNPQHNRTDRSNYNPDSYPLEGETSVRWWNGAYVQPGHPCKSVASKNQPLKITLALLFSILTAKRMSISFYHSPVLGWKDSSGWVESQLRLSSCSLLTQAIV